ncbi:MAG: adenosylcobinamide-phosphate synthase CbiB [Pseudomonadota bacterium]
MLTFCVVVVLALIADHVFGEPPVRWHPVVWLGNLAQRVESELRDSADTASAQRNAGVLALLAVVLVALLPVLVLGALLPDVVIAVAVLTLAIGRRSLAEHARAVATPLAQSDLETSRAELAKIVSRDTAALEETEIAAATVESVLENGADAVFAALFWAAVLGPVGAVMYRAANTLDAMWGYRNDRYTHFGWAAARFDDLLNWVPARLTALTYLAIGRSRSAWRAWQSHDWYSGNAGAVMASGAGALGLQLGGDTPYGGVIKSRPTLGHGREPRAGDIERAVALVDRGVVLWVLCLGFAALGTLL